MPSQKSRGRGSLSFCKKQGSGQDLRALLLSSLGFCTWTPKKSLYSWGVGIKVHGIDNVDALKALTNHSYQCKKDRVGQQDSSLVT